MAGLALAAGLLWLIAPRQQRLPSDVVEPTSNGNSALAALANDITAALSLSPVDRVMVGSHHSSYALRAGWSRRRVLVVALPQWLTLTPAERVALVAAEVAGLEARGGPTIWLTAWADGILSRVVDLTLPASRRRAGQDSADTAHGDLGAFGFADEMAGHAAVRDATESAGAASMAFFSRPLRAIQDRLRILEVRWLSSSLIAGDRRVREVFGPLAMTSMFLSTLTPARGVFAAERAVRSGQDPLAALDGVERPTEDELHGRWRRATSMTLSSRDGLIARRLEALGCASAHDDGSRLTEFLGRIPAADAEVRATHVRVRPVYRDLLLTGTAET